MKILIVDDREEERYLAETLLKGSGYDVVSATNGAEVLEKLRANGFDMIVSDILMPVMDGFRLCLECKRDEKLKDIPFVFYTATYTDAKDEELALKMGAEKYIRKPIEPEEFVRIIQSVFREAEEGKIGTKKLVVEEEEEVLKLYSERLLAKLEKKMLELEAETAQRKQAEERLEHLNRLLRAIRDVNQLIVREKDRDRLLKRACDNLTKTGGYYNTWIAILDESGGLVATAEAGVGEDFLPMVEQLKRGELVTCTRQALGQAGVVAIKDPFSTCSDCPLAKKCRGRAAMTIRLEHNEKVYGLLFASIPAEFAADKEEQSMFQEVGEDIAFALHDIELEEKRKQAQHNLNERVKELQCLYGIANLVERPALTLDELYQEAVNLLPTAWQYPEITCARITIDDKEFRTNNYRDSKWKQSSEIKVNGAKVGAVEVSYLEEKPELDEGPFSKEERQLIDAVAERLGRITERKRAEEALRESERNFRNSIDDSPLGIRIISAEGDLIYANRAILDIYGYINIEELRNTLTKQRYTPESYDEHQERKGLRRSGKHTPSEYEINITRKDGEIRHLLVSRKEVMWDGNTQFQVLYQDITARKRAEKEFENTFNLSPDMLGIFNTDGALSKVNPAWEIILGYKPKELYEMGWTQLVHPDDVAKTNAEVAKQLEGGSVVNFINRYKCKDGSYKTLEWQATFADEGLVYATARDITERKRAEEALRESERNFRNSIDDSPLGIRIISAEGDLIYANRAVLDIYGYSNIEELRNTLTKQRYTPESHDEHQERKGLRRSGKHTPSEYEINIRRKDGEIRHLLVSRKEVMWDGNTQFQVLYQDITARKQAEEALRESEEKYRAIYFEARDGIVLIDSENGYIIDCNPEFENQTGRKLEQLTKMKIWQVRPPEKIEAAEKTFLEIVEKGIGGSNELEIQKPDGKIVPVEFLTKRIKIQGKDYLQTIARDITKRKQAEEALRESEERFRSVAETAIDAIISADSNGTIAYWNSAAETIFGFSADEVIGKPVTIIIPKRLRKAHLKSFERVILTGETKVIGQIVELVGLRKDGSEFPIDLSIAAWETATEQFFTTIIRDISERKRMEEQLIVTDRLASIGELVSGVAHELNNPLTSVIGFSELLADRKDLPDDVKEDLKLINKEAQRTSNIVKNLLTFARKQPKEKQPIDINMAIAVVLELRAYEQKVSNLQINIQLASDLPEITANASDLQQVFLNIIVNAEHAMLEAHGKGTITITTERDGNIIRVSLADDGPGISEENLGHIFDPFFTTKEVGKGTGLGLSICHGTITEHGGKIYAESELGKGTTFIIELPVATTDNEGTTSENS